MVLCAIQQYPLSVGSFQMHILWSNSILHKINWKGFLLHHKCSVLRSAFMFHYFKCFIKNHLHLEVHSTYQMTNLLKEGTPATEDSCRNFNACPSFRKSARILLESACWQMGGWRLTPTMLTFASWRTKGMMARQRVSPMLEGSHKRFQEKPLDNCRLTLTDWQSQR